MAKQIIKATEQDAKCPCCGTGTPAKNKFDLCSPCYRDVAREMKRDRAAARGGC